MDHLMNNVIICLMDIIITKDLSNKCFQNGVILEDGYLVPYINIIDDS